jgi:hypothetical protein
LENSSVTDASVSGARATTEFVPPAPAAIATIIDGEMVFVRTTSGVPVPMPHGKPARAPDAGPEITSDAEMSWSCWHPRSPARLLITGRSSRSRDAVPRP